MSKISIEVGKRIRAFRKKRSMTLEDLSLIICKGKSTISKYENGEISIDIETMYDIANALHIHVGQLLYCPSFRASMDIKSTCPAFLKECLSFTPIYLMAGAMN